MNDTTTTTASENTIILNRSLTESETRLVVKALDNHKTALKKAKIDLMAISMEVNDMTPWTVLDEQIGKVCKILVLLENALRYQAPPKLREEDVPGIGW